MSKQKRKEILLLEKQMQKKATADIVLALAEKYVGVNEPHQAVAVLIEGSEMFPKDLTILVTCAQCMISYQTDEITRAELLIKQVLDMEPDHRLAQKLLEQIHTQVDTMHEVARESDTKELQAQHTIKMQVESQDDIPKYHERLTEGYRLFHSGQVDEALEKFQLILEEDPDNPDAQEGFRLSYTEKMKSQETDVRQERLERKLEVVKRSLHFLEAMKEVVTREPKK